MLGSVEFGRNNCHPKDRIRYVELMLITTKFLLPDTQLTQTN